MSETYELGLTFPAELELTEQEISDLGDQFKADVIETLRAKGVIELPVIDDVSQVVPPT